MNCVTSQAILMYNLKDLPKLFHAFDTILKIGGELTFIYLSSMFKIDSINILVVFCLKGSLLAP